MFTWNRKSLDLNGKWKFCPDPMQRCRRQQWWRNPTKPDSIFPCWDTEGLWDINVPGTWKTQFEELKWYDGHAVYMKDFDVNTIPKDHEAFLVFDGIVYSSQIFLNGQLMGEHDWGYSPFQLRVTDAIRRRNRLFVLVENHLKKDRVPGEIYDWNNDGGIVSGVKLVFVPVTHIHNFKAETRLEEDKAAISFSVWLESRDVHAMEKVEVSIPELGMISSGTVRVGEKLVLEFNVSLDKLALWSPENPKLYDVELKTRHETLRDEVGFREIRTDGGQIILNRRPIRLYGLCIHSEFKGTGRTATPEGIELMLKWVKELGVNFLRCAHYPYPEIFGRALDKTGIMWWEETPAYWLQNMYEEGQTRLASGILADAVRRDWNRASLIIWSVSNECCWRNPDNPKETNYPYWFKVVPMLRSMDPTRLISCAEAGNMISVKPVWAPDKADEFNRAVEDAGNWLPGHTDEWYELFDILAANIYVNDLKEAEISYPRYVEMFKRYNKPMILSEFGAMSLRGCDLPGDKLGTEAFHARLFTGTFRIFEKLPELVGYCPWCLNDVRVPIHWRWYNQGKGVFRYGVLDENYEVKTKVFAALKKAIADIRVKFGNWS